ncbi:MAG: Ku protein [Spirochaetes bacterium RBG_16_49_21]|nr:MAG: Ku protein [Spirochaetes bacterium RBG_16_49_21]
MELHSSWKGFIQFSLVTIPVKAITVHETEREVALHQLHKDCNQRINYKKSCKVHGEVKQSDIIRGYEYGKEQYVIIEDDEISKLRSQSDHAVHINGFVSADKLEWLYREGKNYYLIPDGKIGQKPYALLRDTMTEAGSIALANIIISSKEHLVVLQPYKKLIAMAELYYHDQVKEENEFEKYVEDVEIEPNEKELTRTLIRATEIKEFDIKDYKDGYREKILKLIDIKVQGKEIVAAEKSEEPVIINLMEALKKSVEMTVKQQKHAG